MTDYVTRGSLHVAEKFASLVENEILPGLDMAAERIWQGLEGLVRDFSPRNMVLLDIRENLQISLDIWQWENRESWDNAAYKDFLHDIGYLVDDGPEFQITTEKTDAEIAILAGPQLVVPVDNARYALNAANARWGSLYDALYGTDVIEQPENPTSGYDAARGARVIAWANDFLDKYFPLAHGSHGQISDYHLVKTADNFGLEIKLQNGQKTGLRDPALFTGHQAEGDILRLLFCHHGLHVEIVIDRNHPVGADNPSGVSDVILESALSVIMDCEDSVAAVDADDKVAVYRNWLGLMKGDLAVTFKKGAGQVERTLNPDREYIDICGGSLVLPGRSLMLVRNVGHLMTTDTVRDAEGAEIPEGLLDVLITSLCGLHDLGNPHDPDGKSRLRNSRAGSIYIVKPKMHGPDEAAFANDVFNRVEDILGLARHTIKIGVMDEERRTTLNLAETIRAVKDRIFFINTGFLDRTGDEIHTDMAIGPMVRKNAMKDELWIDAYERWNVDIGLKCGLKGRAQIGKGMWAMPEEMRQMLMVKGGQLSAGATCAWVPSPTAATLHAIHYHEIDVAAVQAALTSRPRAALDDLLKIPLLTDLPVDGDDIKSELDNNCQGLLGYVVRWIDQGIGCSKVPDINDVGLMEDRATLRISSQHIANWLYHGICTEDEVMATMKRMARIVDSQNSSDPCYRAMAPDFDGVAFRAACDLIFRGREQPSGYTEPILHARRREAKALGI